MPSANVDLVRSIYAAWERGDYSSADWAHPEIEYVIVGGPSPGSWTGLAAMAQAAGDWLSAWEEFRIRAVDFRRLDQERVLVLSEISGRGKTSGLQLGEMLAEGAGLFHMCEGKVVRQVVYPERARAFADLGLAPDPEPEC